MKKTAVVTGATAGLGRALAHRLVRRGYKLVIPCRGLEKAEALRASLTLRFPQVELDFLPCDLADLASVARCGEAIAARHPVIDLIVANAATVSPRKILTPQGVERTFAVNHLAHFVLVHWLLDNLFTHSRVITVASSGARWARPDFLDDPGYRHHRYGRFRAYANSKLANIAFSGWLSRQLQPRQIASVCVHPGMLDTGIWLSATSLQKLVVNPLRKLYLDSPERGAEVIEHFATAPQHNETTGYFDRTRRLAPPAGVTEGFEYSLYRLSLAVGGDFLPPGVMAPPARPVAEEARP